MSSARHDALIVMLARFNFRIAEAEALSLTPLSVADKRRVGCRLVDLRKSRSETQDDLRREAGR
jgi:hypothetical protein